ncbi:MAG: OmpA family protein [Bacteroidota bacterium]
MRKSIYLLILCVSMSAFMSSCVSKKKFTELMGNKESLEKMLSEQKSKVASLEGDVENLQGEKESLQKQNGELSSRVASLESEASTLKAENEKSRTALTEKESQLNSLRNAVKETFASAKGSGVTFEERNDRLYVKLGEPILYRSGSVRLQRKYKESLNQLAEILKANPNMKVQVEGHTDSKKMKPGARYQDNWELSVGRAMGVVRALVRSGVAENQLAAVGKGEFLPASAEDSVESRKQNRRVEIVILPTIGSLYEVSNSGV